MIVLDLNVILGKAKFNKNQIDCPKLVKLDFHFSKKETGQNYFIALFDYSYFLMAGI